MPRPRRGSSNLGEDPRGDTGGPAMSTMGYTSAANEARYAEEKAQRPHSKRRKAKSVLRRWKQISLRHTWLNPLIIVLVLLGLYATKPGPENVLHHAIFLSYPLGPDYEGGPEMYGKGKLDLVFVGFYTIVLSFTREFFMQRVIRPMAVAAGITKRAKQYRFMEQVYTAMYFAIFGPFGLYVMKYSDRGSLWYFNTTNMFEGYPHRKHEAIFKAYYLLQASYWSQQAIVLMLQLEKPRKDFKELVLHHIVTLALIALSYRFHFMKMGIAVYITMDISDFFLATSKTLNYLDSILVGPYFAVFIAIWIYLRHYLNLVILWATLTEFRTVGPFEFDWAGQQYKCLLSQVITFGLLASLQAVNLFWLFLILRIAKNYVFSSVWQDERSDNEEEEEEEDSDDEVKVKKDTTTAKQQKLINGGSKKATSTPNRNGLANQTPALHLNGQPVRVGNTAKAEGVKQRRKA